MFCFIVIPKSIKKTGKCACNCCGRFRFHFARKMNWISDMLTVLSTWVMRNKIGKSRLKPPAHIAVDFKSCVHSGLERHPSGLFSTIQRLHMTSAQRETNQNSPITRTFLIWTRPKPLHKSLDKKPGPWLLMSSLGMSVKLTETYFLPNRM